MPLPVYVISLPHCQDRRALMEQQFDRLALKATFVDGVYPKDFTEAQAARYDRDRALAIYGIDMTKGEMACVFAHERALGLMIEHDQPVALILEDDITLDDSLPEVLDQLVSVTTSPPWCVVRLDTSRKKAVGRAIQNTKPVADLPVARKLYRLDTHILGSVAYVVTREGAKRILAGVERIFMPFDHMIDRYWENGIAPFIVFPPVISHRDDLASEIGDRSRERRQGLPSSVRWRRRFNRWKDGVNKRLYRLRHF